MLKKEIRDARRAAGLCTICGRESTQGYATCEACREYAKKRREHRKAIGKCISCGDDAEYGYVKCAQCMEKDQIYKKQMLERYKKAGKCWGCGAETNGGGIYCEKCKAKKREENKARQRFMLERGLCTQCGKTRPFEGRHLCEECLQKKLESQWARLETHDGREKAKMAQDAWRQRMREAGRCERCGGAKENQDLIHCDRCRYKDAIQSKIYRERNRAWRPGNLCIWCDALAVPGKKLCEKHYAAQVESIGKARAAINMKNHPWREANRCPICTSRRRESNG